MKKIPLGRLCDDAGGSADPADSQILQAQTAMASRRRNDSQGENGSLVGVDPAGGAQHPLLGQLAVHPQQRKEDVRLLTVQRPLFRALPKIGVERAGAVKKGKLVHVPVRAAALSAGRWRRPARAAAGTTSGRFCGARWS